jgi:uncharacterized protein YrrD
MRKGKDLIGKPVIAYDTGEIIDTVTDLIFDQDQNRLMGLLIDEKGWFSDAKVLPLSQIQSIGLDGIIVPSATAVQISSHYPDLDRVLKRNNILNGTKIMTVDGRDLGQMVDLFFDDQTGQVLGYEVSGGLFADAYSGRSYVPAPQTLKIGEDVAFVPSEVADLMEEQTGGIKAAVLTASEKIQQTAQTAGTALEEVGRTAASKVANVILNPAEQKAFVVGRIAEETVKAPGGGDLILRGATITPEIAEMAEYIDVLDDLYRAAGGCFTEKIGERLGQQVATLTIEQTEGQRVHETVYTSEGFIIAAAGQIVNKSVIERAKAHQQEADLLSAVGLSRKAAAKSQVTDLVSSTTQQVQKGTSNLWDKVKETASELQERGTQAVEEQRIKGALGRPVTRVILDRHDQVILNVGDLITHQAISTSREAGVLDLLLSSVYTETPKLSTEELRAPDTGKAAL